VLQELLDREAAGASGCTAGGLPKMSPFGWTTSWETARLTARPPAAESPQAAPAPGVLDLGPGPAVLVRVPAPVGDPVRPHRLVLALHGAGGNARQGLAALLPFADTHQLLLLRPAPVTAPGT
jgi:phospholipase/carboxylesterase